MAGISDGKHEEGQRHAHKIECQRRRIGQCVFDQYKCRAPHRNGEEHEQVGAQLHGMAWAAPPALYTVLPCTTVSSTLVPRISGAGIVSRLRSTRMKSAS